MIARIAVLATVGVSLAACVAGREVSIRPQSDRAQYQCGSYTIRPDGFFSDGFLVVHYLFIPFWTLTNNSRTDTQLEVRVTIHSAAEPVFDLHDEDVQIQIVKTGQAASPSKVELVTNNQIPSKPWYYKTFRFTFDVDRHATDDFVLIFPKPVHGCSIPNTLYKKEDRTHWASSLL